MEKCLLFTINRGIAHGKNHCFALWHSFNSTASLLYFIKNGGDTMDGALAYKIEDIVEAVDWEKRYVNTLVRIAGQYVERQELDLAKHLLEEAKQYDNGTYRRQIEQVEFHLGIEETFLTGNLSEYLK